MQHPDLTDKEWMALALHLLKNYRQAKSLSHRDDATPVGTAERNIDVADHALELAKKFGLKDEFLDLLGEVPIIIINARELDEWSDRLRHVSMRVTVKPRTRSQKKTSKGNPKVLGVLSKHLRQPGKVKKLYKDLQRLFSGKPTRESPPSSPAA